MVSYNMSCNLRGLVNLTNLGHFGLTWQPFFLPFSLEAWRTKWLVVHARIVCIFITIFAKKAGFWALIAIPSNISRKILIYTIKIR